MDDHFDIGRVFEIGKFDITRLTCILVPHCRKRSPLNLNYVHSFDRVSMSCAMH